MQLAAGLVAGESLDADGVQAVEDTLFDVRVFALETLDERLDFLTLAAATAVVANGAAFGKAVGALDKLQPVVIFPVDDVLLVDAIHGADEFHSTIIHAVELGHHALQLRAVEHRHDGGLDDVGEVVTQRNLVAAQVLCLVVEVAAAHLGANVAGGSFGVVRHVENVRLENGDGNFQKFRIAFDFLAVDFVVAGVHHQVFHVEFHVAMAVEHLDELRHEHGILAAGNADGDFVAFFDELVVLDGGNERCPEPFAVRFRNAPFYALDK